jgi:uncharacterized protein YaiI (UPF0178 family)
VTTTTAPDFLVVSEHVARNPVARAIARQRIADAVRDFQIRLHLLEDGDDVQADIPAAAKVLAVALSVMQQTGRMATPEARVMSGAMGQCAAVSQRRYRWTNGDAVAIDEGLRRAVEVYRNATAAQVQAAHRHITSLEKHA